MTQPQSKSLAGPLLRDGQGVALTLQDGMIVRAEIAKFDAAAEAAGCADHAMDTERLLRFGGDKFDAHVRAGLQFNGDVDGDSILRNVVSATLQHASSLLHRSEELDGEVDSEAGRTPHSIPEIDV